MNESNILIKELEKVSFMKTLLTTKNGLFNLIMATLGWITATFVFFLMDFFVKYLPGDIYVNQLIASFSTFGNMI